MRPMSAAERFGNGLLPGFLERFLAGSMPASTARAAASFASSELFQTGFPAARMMADPSLFLDGYSALLSQRAGDEGRDATRLLTALRVLATLEAQAVPDQRIWDAADINKSTWKAYDDLLSRTHIAVPTPALESNRLARLTTYPKRYLADVALSLQLAGLSDSERSNPTVLGPYFESYVGQQLRPSRSDRRHDQPSSHWLASP